MILFSGITSFICKIELSSIFKLCRSWKLILKNERVWSFDDNYENFAFFCLVPVYDSFQVELLGIAEEQKQNGVLYIRRFLS